MTIEVTDGDTVKTYAVKPFEAITLADYRAMTVPAVKPEDFKDGMELTYELCKRLTGIPKKDLRRMPVDQAMAFIASVQDVYEAVAQAKEGDSSDLPRSFDHRGKTYTLPADLASAVTLERYSDLLAVTDGAEHEADAFEAILAVLCVPEGEEYDPADIPARRKVFHSLPMHVVLGVCGPFIDSSSALRSLHARVLSRSLTRTASEALAKLKGSRKTTGSTPSSSGLPSLHQPLPPATDHGNG